MKSNIIWQGWPSFSMSCKQFSRIKKEWHYITSELNVAKSMLTAVFILFRLVRRSEVKIEMVEKSTVLSIVSMLLWMSICCQKNKNTGNQSSFLCFYISYTCLIMYVSLFSLAASFLCHQFLPYKEIILQSKSVNYDFLFEGYQWPWILF